MKLDPWGVQLLDTSRHCPLGCEGTGNQLHYSLQVYQLINIAALRVRKKIAQGRREIGTLLLKFTLTGKIGPNFVARLLPDLSSGALGCDLAVNALLGGDSLAEACRPLPWWAGSCRGPVLKSSPERGALRGRSYWFSGFFPVFELK